MSDIKELRIIRQDFGFAGDAERVLSLARPLIQSERISAAGDEAWDIYEQALMAAMETSEDKLALTCLTRLADQFPQSGRVHALRGMMLEVTQEPEEALKFYNNVLSMEPTNVPIIKRRIAFHKTLGKLGDAIAFLVEYLDVYYSDADAWAELGDLYSALEQFEKAAFCWSEVLLLKPHDHNVYASYADTLLAQYLQDSDVYLLHAATKSYLRSIELCDDYDRGFCGVKVCCNKLLQSKSSQSNSDRQLAAPDKNLSIPVETIKALDLMATKYLTKLMNDHGREAKDASITKFAGKLISPENPMIR